MDSVREVGRPIKLNDLTRSIIIEGVRNGLPYEKCCARARVSYRAYRTWILKGEEELENEGLTEDDLEISSITKNRSVYANFVLDHRVAEAEAIDEWMSQIDRAGKDGQWQAAAWRLERRYPKDFGRHLLELSGPDGKELPAQPTAITVVEVIKKYVEDPEEGENA